jgi:pimeloyl-ACP methyl ester carboxylesterase
LSAFNQHAFFLNADGHALAATCFAPETVCGAVLLIPPFAEERKGTLPVFVQTARELAGRNIACLLFDFSGCGDSEGDFASTPPATLEADCEAALAWISAAFPAVPLAVLGVRTGALLACRLAAKRSDVTALMLWSPVTGPDFLRQLLQRRMVNDMVAYGKAQESRAALEARLQRGETVDLDGYAFSGAFYTWAHALLPQPVTAPALLIAGGHDERTSAACASSSPAVTRAELRYPPFWNTVGHVDLAALVSETASWLSVRLSAAAAVSAAIPALCTTAPFGELADLPAAQTVRAIFDTPAAAPAGGVLFLHGWSGDRTGPHRLFTRFARQLAGQGYLCARPDFIGRGLSDGAASEASIARMTENAQTALNELRRRLPSGAPIAVAAICSGCKVAIALTSQNQDIAKLLLWSAESMGSLRSAATGRRKTLSALATYARKLLRPETWKKILSGKVQTGLVTQALVKHETRSSEEAAWEDGVLRVFRSYRNPVLFVFGGSDPDAPGSSRAYADYCRKSGIPHTQHTIAHAGHSYYGEAWTRDLLDVSVLFLSAH